MLAFKAPRIKVEEKNVTVVVDLNDKRDAQKPPTLDRIIALTADDLKGVNEVILEQMQSPVLLIPQLAGHIIAAGGKRIVFHFQGQQAFSGS